MQPLPVQKDDQFTGQYTLACQHEGCGHMRIIKHFVSAGLKIGDMVPQSPAEPDFGRCLRCKRYSMKVTAAPPPPAPLKPKGFTRVPTR